MTSNSNRIAIAAAMTLLVGGWNCARADIVYTWQEDDNQSAVVGFLQVTSSVQSQGFITYNDITGFTFYDFTTWHYPFVSVSSDHLLVSSADAGFSGATGEIVSGNALSTITIDANFKYDVVGGEKWSRVGYDGTSSGVGHWVVSGAAVPEPASLATLGAGAVCVLGYARRRKANA